ncbi:hypothetical protein JTE90_011148 [Oedothorax gibbosus]|uniref:Uncharacterized protein n=1 Tax=Oedothorax gibbosus TaxID=931172 RepID=A0AAV6TZT4_9ARAC|nr:hypothetical protein JTE90_011148 [Oedothorax gibbosus]
MCSTAATLREARTCFWLCQWPTNPACDLPGHTVQAAASPHQSGSTSKSTMSHLPHLAPCRQNPFGGLRQKFRLSSPPLLS